ncbi:MAG: spore germination protein [Bacillota bacterium]
MGSKVFLGKGVYPIRYRRGPKERYNTGPEQVPYPHEFLEISPDLAENEKFLRQEFDKTTDIVFREFYMGEIRCLAVWVDGLINNRVSHDLFRALMLDVEPSPFKKLPASERLDYVNKHLLPFYATIRVIDMIELRRWILMHKLVLLMDGSPNGLVLDAEATPVRGISEPTLESVVSGPRDAFVESLRVNTALIRARLGDARLKSENYILGRRSNTLVTIMYVEDLARPEVIEEVRSRMKRIDTDAIWDVYQIKEFIHDRRVTLFPLIKETERPDKVAADLLEGRFAVIVDGSPQVLTAPSVMVEFFQSAEDYYLNPMIATGLRILRYLGLFIACTGLGFYVAVTTFHQEMIPIPLIFSVAGTRETVPFPAVIEALFMLVIFELLVEAGIRLPRVVGGAVNIVGALIIGQASVQAGIVSPILVILIAATAISNFAVSSNYQFASVLRFARFLFLIAGATLGLYGMSLVLLCLLIHMTHLKSFGVPYLTPLAPRLAGGTTDVVYRAPKWQTKSRPSYVTGNDLTRDNSQPPVETPEPDSASGAEETEETR